MRTTTQTKHSLEEVLEAVEKGITKMGAAKVLGCPWQTLNRYCHRWESVDAAIKTKRRELVDLAEMGLRGAVIRQEPWAVTFTLRTLGKDEGYTDRTEHTGKDGGPIDMKITEMVVRMPEALDGDGEDE